MTARPIFYMAHPVAGDITANLARAKRWLKWLLTSCPEIDVTAPWISWVEVLGEGDEETRKRGLRFDCETVRRCDGLILCGGRVTHGMAEEVRSAQANGLLVMDLTKFGEEPDPLRIGGPICFAL